MLLADALADLPPDYREVIILRNLERLRFDAHRADAEVRQPRPRREVADGPARAEGGLPPLVVAEVGEEAAQGGPLVVDGLPDPVGVHDGISTEPEPEPARGRITVVTSVVIWSVGSKAGSGMARSCRTTPV